MPHAIMVPQGSSLEALPNELLDEIISNLSYPPPSLAKLHQPPSRNIVKSGIRDLKNLSCTSSRLLEVTRPRLFTHVCIDLRDVDEFLSFISATSLARHVSSAVIKGRHPSDDREDPFWWRRVLSYVDPQRITIIAPPSFIGKMTGAQVSEEHSWAFQAPLQILQLEQDTRSFDPPPLTHLEKRSTLLEARSWSSLLFNESSSLKAYNHYEYFLFKVPSLFSTWGSLEYVRPRPQRLISSPALSKLTSFRYTAVFPFYNHVKLVLNAVELMENLRSLSVQLAPCEGDKATELEQRGSMDPSDPWMEITTGYSLIGHSVSGMGNRGSLAEFCACDYALDPLRTELSPILEDILGDSEWAHDGQGTWTKKSICSAACAPATVEAIVRTAVA
ncbi:hypothetical protein BDV38DRAFT_238737 [Aspergillus pseudotamarii]|uniref:F-box domain-containing protein n=1 Tax=Aspergillus pseudotamarii TaxID=132259 RepID=A0A5N6T477_ASPPS|nr:uncharacterized protein BDV38DRAFT_238737 [Aspergillus pseudotamarii]KAE8141116.1 hypothetical protein BDV38DRAFT_238737 [Aspergillus pseudotamarii]